MHRIAHRQRGNTLLGLVIGLLIGVLIAAAVAVFINFGPKPFVETRAQKPAPLPREAPPAPAQSAVTEKPRLDFYRILPEGESAPSPAITRTAEPQAAEKLYLQAGAFQNPTDADNLKARLAMGGIEANVQRADLAAKGIYYRVRIGPFATADAADIMRARLGAEGIEATKVKAAP